MRIYALHEGGLARSCHACMCAEPGSEVLIAPQLLLLLPHFTIAAKAAAEWQFRIIYTHQ